MEKFVGNGEYGIEGVVAQGIVDSFDESIVDSHDIAVIMKMTPSDGYQKKLDLICQAEDMSTREKIQAINQAEDKYANDLERSTNQYKDLMKLRAELLIFAFIGYGVVLACPKGEKVLRSLLKRIA